MKRWIAASCPPGPAPPGAAAANGAALVRCALKITLPEMYLGRCLRKRRLDFLHFHQYFIE
jgi:hypothetical protein